MLEAREAYFTPSSFPKLHNPVYGVPSSLRNLYYHHYAKVSTSWRRRVWAEGVWSGREWWARNWHDDGDLRRSEIVTQPTSLDRGSLRGLDLAQLRLVWLVVEA